jgi:uncharacterized membrane protein
MIPSLGQIVAAIIALIAIDSLWLFTFGQYSLQMTERIQTSPVLFNLLAAVVVYIALTYLVFQVNSVMEAALMGSAVYAVYDFTNLALLKKYEIGVAVADTIWGGVLFASVFSILKYLKLN